MIKMSNVKYAALAMGFPPKASTIEFSRPAFPFCRHIGPAKREDNIQFYDADFSLPRFHFFSRVKRHLHRKNINAAGKTMEMPLPDST